MSETRKKLQEVVFPYKEGDYVRLKPNAEENWPEEFGVIEMTEPEADQGRGMVVVRVDDKYRESGDDGAREVTLDQIEMVTKGPGVDVGQQSAGTTQVKDYMRGSGQLPSN
jgi:hypothetical protein